MKLRTLMLYIGLAILGFYLIGFVLNLAAWALDIALTIGVVLVILALINKFYDSRKNTKNQQ
jgi:CHASE2 domain-containing sensor protein